MNSGNGHWKVVNRTNEHSLWQNAMQYSTQMHTDYKQIRIQWILHSSEHMKLLKEQAVSQNSSLRTKLLFLTTDALLNPARKTSRHLCLFCRQCIWSSIRHNPRYRHNSNLHLCICTAVSCRTPWRHFLFFQSTSCKGTIDYSNQESLATTIQQPLQSLLPLTSKFNRGGWKGSQLLLSLKVVWNKLTSTNLKDFKLNLKINLLQWIKSKCIIGKHHVKNSALDITSSCALLLKVA